MAEPEPAPRGAPLLSARGLCKRFVNGGTSVPVLEDLDIDLAVGESVAVVGASGIGKSTLLHVLGTLERPDRGRLLVRGEDVLAYSAERLARFRNETIGFVFQFHHLLPEFTALENAMMPALIHGLRRREAADRARAVLVRVGMEKRLSFRVNRLSGGEQQRVAIARALVLRPPILLADEPTGNLDRTNGEEVHRLLLELNAELGMTLVIVTHNLELAARLSRRVTLRDGRLAALH